MRSPGMRAALLKAFFSELRAGGTNTASRPNNPFDNDAFEAVDMPAETRDELVTLPPEIEVPSGYEDVAHLRDALASAWRMDWIKIGKDSCVVRLPVGWSADRSVDGMLRIYCKGVTRAEGKLVQDAALRLLSRFYLQSEVHPSDDRCRIVVRDRAGSQRFLKASFWDVRSGPNHPQWKVLAEWLAREYPHHRDPLRYWEDCDHNLHHA